MNLKNALCILAAIAVLSAAALAQRSLTVGSPVMENFDAGLGTGSVIVNNNSTILGIYATRTTGNTASPPGNTLPANNGTTNTGGLYNMGSTGSLDRSLGTVSTTVSGTNHLGLRIVNSGSNPITSLQVQYTGEEWRHGNGANETLTFEYQTGTSVTDLTSGTWTAVTGLSFLSPANPPGQGALDGNAAANRTTLSSILSVNIPSGTEIMLRWTDIVDSAQPDAFGIDDITITAIGPTAAGAGISGRVVNSIGAGIRGALVSVTDGASLTRVVYSNTFGYFSISDLPVGESYILTVSSRSYTFANPTRLIDLTDDYAGLIFRAN